MGKGLLKKAEETKSLDELKALIGENGFDMDEKKAEKIYERVHSDGALSDEKLEGLSGGLLFGADEYDIKDCPKCYRVMRVDHWTNKGRCPSCGYEGKVPGKNLV